MTSKLETTGLRMKTPAELAAGLDDLRKRGVGPDDAGLLAAAASYIGGATDSLREHMAEVGRLRAVIRANALRWAPHLTHAEIDEVIHGKQS
jgi:hypothetical protein